MKLSEYQLKIINEMYSKNLYLVTNEGSKYKCWLEDKLGSKCGYVNKRTVEILFSLGLIVPFDTDTKPQNIFMYKLSDRRIKFYVKK